MTGSPLDTTGPRQRFFEAEPVDHLVTMMLELAAEVWAVRERLYIIEKESARLGLPLGSAVEGHVLSPEEQAELAEMRRHMLANILRTVGRPHRDPPEMPGTTAPRAE
ncbi:MAG TPA: hypothetical protein VF745_13245 [Steroidobacteraceae bacterium]